MKNLLHPSRWFRAREVQQEIPESSCFSESSLRALIDEHRFISSSLAHLSSSFPAYARAHGNDPTVGAISSLKAKKVELEAKIEVLQRWLTARQAS